jgi:hypothetical protein
VIGSAAVICKHHSLAAWHTNLRVFLVCQD